MRSRIAGLTMALSSAAWVVVAGCGGSSGGTGAGGHGGGGHAGGNAGAGGGTAGAGGSAAGTAGGAGGAGGAAVGVGGGTAGGTAGGSAGADGGAGTMVTVPAILAVPTGATLKFHAQGRGSQIYTCTATAAATDGGADAGSTYGWVLKAPDAKLYDENDAQIGTHFAGPTWLSTDGSDAVGTKLQQADSPLADAIPWLLLKVTQHMGSGVFMDVTYVQRLNTTKGKAPATGCDSTTVGTDVPVAYTADYYFYKGGVTATDGGVAADWPFQPITIPAGVATPAGTTLTLKLHGWGSQVYTCTAMVPAADGGVDAGATTYAWVLKAPDAKLYDDANALKGTHSAGPTWTSTDTSSIVGTKLVGIDSQLSDAIQWLLLKVASHAGATGVFTNVTYVQRLNKSKGKAPATGCDVAHVNMDTAVAYSADYYYSTGEATADGGTDAASD